MILFLTTLGCPDAPPADEPSAVDQLEAAAGPSDWQREYQEIVNRPPSDEYINPTFEEVDTTEKEPDYGGAIIREPTIIVGGGTAEPPKPLKYSVTRPSTADKGTDEDAEGEDGGAEAKADAAAKDEPPRPPMPHWMRPVTEEIPDGDAPDARRYPKASRDDIVDLDEISD